MLSTNRTLLSQINRNRVQSCDVAKVTGGHRYCSPLAPKTWLRHNRRYATVPSNSLRSFHLRGGLSNCRFPSDLPTICLVLLTSVERQGRKGVGSSVEGRLYADAGWTLQKVTLLYMWKGLHWWLWLVSRVQVNVLEVCLPFIGTAHDEVSLKMHKDGVRAPVSHRR